MCLCHTVIYLACYLHLSKWCKYLGSVHCQPRFTLLAGKRSEHVWESKNVSSQVKPWRLHRVPGLGKDSAMLHWTGHSAGKLTCQVKGHLEHQMLKFEFVLYLWHGDHCLFWAHRVKKERNIKRLKLCYIHWITFVKATRENNVMLENLSLKWTTFCTMQPNKMHMLEIISAIISIHVDICETLILL